MGIHQALLTAGAGGAAVGWDSTDTATQGGMVLSFSSGDTVVTTSGTTGKGTGRGLTAKTSGLLYFEIHSANHTTAQTWGCGVCDSSATLNSYWQNQTGSGQISYHGNGQMFQNGTTFIANNTAFSGPSIIGVAVDFTGKTVAFYLGNVLKQSGISFSATSLEPYFSLEEVTSFAATLKTTSAAQTYSPPATYSAWN